MVKEEDVISDPNGFVSTSFVKFIEHTLGTQFDGVRSTSQVAKSFIGTGRVLVAGSLTHFSAIVNVQVSLTDRTLKRYFGGPADCCWTCYYQFHCDVTMHKRETRTWASVEDYRNRQLTSCDQRITGTETDDVSTTTLRVGQTGNDGQHDTGTCDEQSATQ